VLVPWSNVSVACFAAYLFLMNVAGGGYWAIPLEFNPNQVGAISGVMNCAGNFAGVFGPMTAGFLITMTGSWSLPFLVAAGFAIISFLIFYFLVIPEPIQEKIRLPEPAVQEARG
jgi:nitrate/nitrite transporter NarK